MSNAVQELRDLFNVEGATHQPDPRRDTERVDQLDLYKSALKRSHTETLNGYTSVQVDEFGQKHLTKGIRPDRQAMVIDNLVKSVGPDVAAALASDIAAMREQLVQGTLNKDWTPTNPVTSATGGLVPFDLEAPAKFLVPRYTPLRNSLPRVKGQGNARRYKRITGVSNSGQGVADMNTFFDSATNTSTWGGPGNLTLNRPSKISYAGDDQVRSYVEQGVSDSVTFKAQFQGLGFEDLRSLSHTALLYAHLMGEERNILFARGATSGGYMGIVAAPSGITTGTATTGGTLAAATYYVYVRSVQGGGYYSAVSTVASQVTTGSTSTLTVTVGTEAAGSLGVYELYVGTTTGIANAKYQTQFTGNTVTITSHNASGAVIAGTDASFSALAYDGFYAVQSDTAQTGYFLRKNGDLNTFNPGAEFDTALVTMWQANGADPDEIWMTGAGRAAYGQLVRLGSASGALSGYRTSAVMGSDMTMGAIVTGHMNPASGKVVDVGAHRFALAGTALIRSRSIPIPASEVPNPVQMVNVQDYMALDWPVIQLTYDISTYQMGTMLHYAPAWSGLIVGITNG